MLFSIICLQESWNMLEIYAFPYKSVIYLSQLMGICTTEKCKIISRKAQINYLSTKVTLNIYNTEGKLVCLLPLILYKIVTFSSEIILLSFDSYDYMWYLNIDLVFIPLLRQNRMFTILYIGQEIINSVRQMNISWRYFIITTLSAIARAYHYIIKSHVPVNQLNR